MNILQQNIRQNSNHPPLTSRIIHYATAQVINFNLENLSFAIVNAIISQPYQNRKSKNESLVRAFQVFKVSGRVYSSEELLAAPAQRAPL